MAINTSVSKDTSLNRVTSGAAATPASATVEAKPTSDVTPTSATPTATPTADSVDVSAEGKQAEAPKNPYEGVSDGFSTVTVDPWKKGKNDTIEGMLRNQGYSLQDIYNKDKDGKTLIDHVAAANNLKNPNVIQDGAELKIPTRANTESMSNMDLENGESQQTEVASQDGNVTTNSEMSKDDAGNSTLDVSVDNDKNPDAGLSTETKVEEGGRIDTASTGSEDSVETNTVAMNEDGSAVTQEKIEAGPNGTEVTIKDIDKKGDNLHGYADANTVDVTNPGSDAAGDVESKVDISERSQDGALENFGRTIAELFGYEGETPDAAKFQGAGEVNVSRGEEGQTTVSTVIDGKRQDILTTPGDTDDTFLERAGEWGDERIQDVIDVGKAGVEVVSDAVEAVGEFAGNAVDAVGEFAGNAANAVGDAAQAGWDNVTGAWKSIFG